MGISLDALQAQVGELVGGRVRAAQPADAVAGVAPRVVVAPGSAEEVAAALAYADRAGLKVVARGGGTQLGLGFPPTGADVLLDTTRLNQLIEHAPHDQTVTLEAGMRLADLQAALAPAGQWLALDPLLATEATVGGVIATNASGARRLRFGGVRDQILGVRVALTDGTLAKGGGKVVKNVAGYDLPKLFTGSLGTLGVIVAATFRLYPLPSASRTVVLRAPHFGPLCELAQRVTASTLVPSIVDILGPAAPGDAFGDNWALAVRFESGVAVAATEQAEELRALAGGSDATVHTLEGDAEAMFWRQVDAWLAPSDDGRPSMLLKASVLPSEVGAWLERRAVEAGQHELAIRGRVHAGHGIIDTRLSGVPGGMLAVLDALRQGTLARRSSLVVQDAPPGLLSEVDVWGATPALEVMRRVKGQFDPNGTLNPGRFVGGI
jgi:glycolate oxidase FAD binding subunit